MDEHWAVEPEWPPAPARTRAAAEELGCRAAAGEGGEGWEEGAWRGRGLEISKVVIPTGR